MTFYTKSWRFRAMQLLFFASGYSVSQSGLYGRIAVQEDVGNVAGTHGRNRMAQIDCLQTAENGGGR
jgi:hypothetical protein